MIITRFINVLNTFFTFYFRWLGREAQRAKENKRKLKASGNPGRIKNSQDKTQKR